MASEATPPESRFLMSKSEKNAFFSKPFNGRILIFWNLILYTFLCTKIKKITMDNFFPLDACLSPMWNGSDADFSIQACFYVTMKYVDAGLEAVQQVLHEDYYDVTYSILFLKVH